MMATTMNAEVSGGRPVGPADGRPLDPYRDGVSSERGCVRREERRRPAPGRRPLRLWCAGSCLLAVAWLLGSAGMGATLSVTTETDTLNDDLSAANDCFLPEAIGSVNEGGNRFGCEAVGGYGKVAADTSGGALGGGIYLDSVAGGAEFINSTLSGNSAQAGGDGSARNDIGAFGFPVPLADLHLNLSDAPDPVAIGSVVVYSFEVTNGGPAVATDTVLSAQVAGGTVVNSGTCRFAGSAGVSCLLGDLAVGDTAKRDIYVGPESAAEGVRVDASVTSDGFDPNPADNSATEITKVRSPEVKLALDVTDSRDPVRPNEEYEYVIRVTNKGKDNAGEMDITALLDRGAVVAAGSGCVVRSEVRTTCTMSGLGSGESGLRTVTVRASSRPLSVQTLEVEAKSPFADTVVDSEHTRVRKLAADLSVAIFGIQDHAAIEGPLSYQLRVHNNGPDTATAVRFSNVIDPSLALAAQPPGCSFAAGTITCTIESLDAGDSRQFTVELAGAAAAVVHPTLVTLSASVSADGFDDPDASDDSVTLAFVTVPLSADVGIVKRAPSEVQTEAPFVYTLIVTNHDVDLASGPIEVHDVLPDGVEFVSADSSPDVFSCSAVGREVVCSADVLAPSQEVVLTLAVAAPSAPGEIRNRASVTSDTLDFEQGNDASEVVRTSVTEADPPPGADLQLVKSGPSSVPAGARFAYALTVVNGGPDAAEGVRIVDTLPEAVSLVGAPGGCSESGVTVRCDLGDIESGALRSLELQVEAPSAAAVLANTALVTSTSSDPDAENDEDSVTTDVTDRSADLVVTKAAPVAAEVGDAFSYRLDVFNAGPDEAVNVLVRDVLPSAVSFVSATPPCVFDAGEVSCPLGSLPVGASAALSIEVSADRVGSVLNIASVSSGVLDPVASNDEGSASTLVLPVGGAVAPSVVVGLGPNAPESRTVSVGSRGEPVLHVELSDPGSQDVVLRSVELLASGSGDDAAGLGAVRLLLDVDGDGLEGPADLSLAGGVFPADDGTLRLRLPENTRLSAGGATDLLVVADVGPSPARAPLLPSLALGVVGLGFMLRRRRHAYLAIGLMLAALAFLPACANQKRPERTTLSYQVTLTQVDGVGASTLEPAEVTGLPLKGARIEVPR